jgi:hypothetical protein
MSGQIARVVEHRRLEVFARNRVDFATEIERAERIEGMHGEVMK